MILHSLILQLHDACMYASTLHHVTILGYFACGWVIITLSIQNVRMFACA